MKRISAGFVLGFLICVFVPCFAGDAAERSTDPTELGLSGVWQISVAASTDGTAQPFDETYNLTKTVYTGNLYGAPLQGKTPYVILDANGGATGGFWYGEDHSGIGFVILEFPPVIVGDNVTTVYNWAIKPGVPDLGDYEPEDPTAPEQPLTATFKGAGNTKPTVVASMKITETDAAAALAAIIVGILFSFTA